LTAVRRSECVPRQIAAVATAAALPRRTHWPRFSRLPL